MQRIAQADVLLSVTTPAGDYQIRAAHVIDATGSRSPFRTWCKASVTAKKGDDRWCIADVRFTKHPPVERHTWVEAPFNEGRAVWQHLMGDDVWRIDYQMAPDADPSWVSREDVVRERLARQFGPDCGVEIVWVGPYAYRSECIDQMRHGRVFFMGDAAKVVSPFGARGGNTGIADADNLAWKLKLVIDGAAPEALLDSYQDERAFAADDNLRHSTRATDFISPKSRVSLRYRNAVLQLAASEPFARPLINSGRLSTPTPYLHSPLNTADEDSFAGAMRPGTNCVDAPLRHAGRDDWLLNVLNTLHGPAGGFTLLAFGERPAQERVAEGRIVARVLWVNAAGGDVDDVAGLLAQRYDARPGTVYLIRPDQHVAARWRGFDAGKIRAALRRATAQP